MDRLSNSWHGKNEGETIFPAVCGGIRGTFCDGLVGFFGCTSRSRTCLMDLEPFWKFDRREQPTSQSFPHFSLSLFLSFCNLFSFLFAFLFRRFSLAAIRTLSRVPSKIPVARTTLIWFRSMSFFFRAPPSDTTNLQRMAVVSGTPLVVRFRKSIWVCCS